MIIYDMSAVGGGVFNNLNHAINILALNGWRCINITTHHTPGGLAISYMNALMEKISS